MAGKYLNEGALGGLSNMSPPRLASSFPSSPMHSDWHQVSQRQENVLLEKLESRLQDRVSMCDISVTVYCVGSGFCLYCVWVCKWCVVRVRYSHLHLTPFTRSNIYRTSINLNEQLMEEVRDNISESMKALERKMRSELRLMVQDPSLGGGGGRGSITGGTGTHYRLHHNTAYQNTAHTAPLTQCLYLM